MGEFASVVGEFERVLGEVRGVLGSFDEFWICFGELYKFLMILGDLWGVLESYRRVSRSFGGYRDF